MRYYFTFAIPVCFGFIVLSMAAEPKPMESAKPDINRLIEQLADIDFRKRDDAAAALEKMGPAILKDLILSREHRDAEVKRRVNSLIDAFESKILLEPKRSP